MKLVDLWLKPLEWLERALQAVASAFTLEGYERWDAASGTWVRDPSVEVDEGDARIYRALSVGLLVALIVVIGLIGVTA